MSLIISFINLDQGSPSILEASTRKVLLEITNNQVLVLKKKHIELILLKVGMSKYKKNTSKKNKSKEKNGKNPSRKGSIRNRKRRQKDKVRSKSFI